MTLRAFPVLHAEDVEAVAGSSARLGFVEEVRIAGADGGIAYLGLRRDQAALGVTTVQAPRALAGVEPQPGPRHELFVYVRAVDETVDRLRADTTIIREAADMPWGERLAYVADPEGNLVVLAQAPAVPSARDA